MSLQIDSKSKAISKKARSCGTCSACCTILRIDSQPGYSTRFDNGEDVAKPAGVTCRFLTSKGCGIYEVRPIVCREFKCDWMLNRKGFADQDEPSKIGYFGIRGSLFVINKK